MIRDMLVGSGLVLALTLSGVAHAEPEAYTLQDLQALIKQQNWLEALQHLNDIKPSQRNQAWAQILETAAVGAVATMEESAGTMEAWGLAQSLMLQFPALKASKKFAKPRNRVGLGALRECFKSSYNVQYCLEETQKLVDTASEDAALAFEAAKIVRLGTTGGTAIIYFERAFKLPQLRDQCADGQVLIAVEQAAGWDGPRAKSFKKVVFDYCWPRLKDKALEVFAEGSSSVHAQMCPELQAKKVLTPFQQALCKDAAKS